MKEYGREVLPTPGEVVTNGRCNLGTFNGPIENVNPLDAEKPLGFPAPWAFKLLRLKEWEALQLASDEWFICVAVYNTKSIRLTLVRILHLCFTIYYPR